MIVHAFDYGMPVLAHGNLRTHKPAFDLMVPRLSSRLEGFTVSLASAISTVAFNTRSISSGPIRLRHQVISEGSIGGAC